MGRAEFTPGELDHYGRMNFPDFRGEPEPEGYPKISSGSVWQCGERGGLYLIQWCGELHPDGRDWLILAYNWETRWHHPTESASFCPCSITSGQNRFNQEELASEIKRRELRQVDAHFEPVVAFRD